MQDIRCDNGILFGKIEDGVLEVKCRSSRCGHEPGVVVIHQFNAQTGDQMGTEMFRDPNHRKER